VGLDPNPDYAATIPHQAFMIFQMMFAIITPALIIGAFAERMRFMPFVVFTLLWATFVYDPVCHWVWGIGRFIRKMGRSGFRGGTVRAYQRGRRGAGLGADSRQTRGLSEQDVSPAQPALLGHGRGPAVGRLVRFQLGQRAERG